MICWLDKVSWKISFPMRLFMAGLWMSVMTVITYVFGIYEWPTAFCLFVGGSTSYLIGQVVLTLMLQDYYKAGADIVSGWRIMKDHKGSMKQD
jgi:hypothetical protein